MLLATPARAQSTTGSFQGTITDQSGAALPGVTVTIANPQTNFVRSTITNASGNYDAALLPPGRYNVSADLPGFKKLEKTGLVLQVNQNARVDFTLELSTVQESVQVTAQAPLVDTQDRSLRQVVDQTQVVGLPGSRSTGLSSSYNLNQPTPGPGAVQARRPYPSYSTITWTDASGTADYRALLTKFQRRLSKGLDLLASYTLSKTVDNTQDGVPNQDPLNRAADEGLASFDRRHRFVLSATYELPFANVAAKDWQVSAIFTATSGMAITAVLAGDRANVGTTNAQRPNVTGDPNANAPHTADEWFDTSVFSIPAQFTYGNAGRSIITGPGFQAVNLAISRRVPLGASRSLDFRIEVFNLLDHDNFYLPDNHADSTQFGQIFQAYDPREMQFGVKFLF